MGRGPEEGLRGQGQLGRGLRAAGRARSSTETRRLLPDEPGGGASRPPGAGWAAAPGVSSGSRADGTHDRPAHRRGGLRGRGRRPRRRPEGVARGRRRPPLPGLFPLAAARERRGRATSSPSPATSTRSSCGAIRTSSETSTRALPGGVRERWEAVKTEQEGARASSTTFRRRSRRCSRHGRCSAARLRSATTGPTSPGRSRSSARSWRERGSGDPGGGAGARDRARRRGLRASWAISSSRSSTSRDAEHRSTRAALDDAPHSGWLVELAAELAGVAGDDWRALDLAAQDAYYDRAKESLA